MSLAQSITNTIKYFEMFDLPLSAHEIYKNLYAPDQNYSFAELLEELEYLKSKNLQEKEGFYFFNGHENSIAIRKKRYLLANAKIKSAKIFIRLIALVPFIKAIFICNNLSYQNAPETSDIDLAIITTPNRIWTSRFFSASLMKILGKRPTDKTRKNKICLSFFVTEDNLNLEKLAYENDIHFIYWLNQFLPIYITNNLHNKFFTANNWTTKYLPNYFNTETCARWRTETKSFSKSVFEKLLSTPLSSPLAPKSNEVCTAGLLRGLAPKSNEVCTAGARGVPSGNHLETLLKKIQLKIMPSHLKQKAQETNSDVIISDTILKFHAKDKRLEIRDRWLLLIKK